MTNILFTILITIGITIYGVFILCILAEQLSYYIIRGYIRGKRITELELTKAEKDVMAQMKIKLKEEDEKETKRWDQMAKRAFTYFTPELIVLLSRGKCQPPMARAAGLQFQEGEWQQQEDRLRQAC